MAGGGAKVEWRHGCNGKREGGGGVAWLGRQAVC